MKKSKFTKEQIAFAIKQAATGARLNARIISPLGATVKFLAGTRRARLDTALWAGAAVAPRRGTEAVQPLRPGRGGSGPPACHAAAALPDLLKTRRKAHESADAALGVELTETTRPGLRARLRGTATRRTVESAKPAARRRAVLADRDLLVDLTGVDYVDSACIALLMIVAKHTARAGRRLGVQRASPYVKRLIHYNCAGFLLT